MIRKRTDRKWRRELFRRLFVFLLLFAGCYGADSDHSIELDGSGAWLRGPALGTTYNIRIAEAGINQDRALVARSQVLATIRRLNALFSTWDSESEISKLNAAPPSTTIPVSSEMRLLIEESGRLHHASGGAFDPGREALFRLWGFGPGAVPPPAPPSEDDVREVLQASGLAQMTLTESGLVRNTDMARLDLNAIAKGYVVDQVFLALGEWGPVMVEIGGEVRVGAARTTEQATRPWRIAIETPHYDGTRSIERVLELENMSLATSGDYRNFYEREGQRFAHIIDPRSGRPTASRVASASVVGPRCATADALATTLIVLSLAEGRQLLQRYPGYAALWILPDQNGRFQEELSPGMEDFLTDE